MVSQDSYLRKNKFFFYSKAFSFFWAQKMIQAMYIFTAEIIFFRIPLVKKNHT